MLKLDSVSHVFDTEDGEQVEVLSDFDLSIPDGQILCLVGPSGCGKSTLLKLMAGFLKPSGGIVTDMEQEITGPSVDRGVVFQQANLFPWLTVAENINLSSIFTGNQSYAEEAHRLLDVIGLKSAANRYPHELSGGMQQRVQIARVLASRPRTILMDEPFSALDPFTREQLHAELLGIWHQYRPTVVFVTHSIDEALLLGHRIVVLGAGPSHILDVIEPPASLRVSDTETSNAERLQRLWHTSTTPEFAALKARLSASIHEAHVG